MQHGLLVWLRCWGQSRDRCGDALVSCLSFPKECRASLHTIRQPLQSFSSRSALPWQIFSRSVSLMGALSMNSTASWVYS